MRTSREAGMRRVQLTMACVSLSILSATICAADIKDGPYDVQAYCSGPANMATPLKDQMGGSYVVRCMTNAQPGTIFHGVTGHCYGAFHQISDAYYEAGSCEFVDGAGDKFFGTYEKRGQANGMWKVTGGTGKYQSLAQSGEWNVALPFPMPTGNIGAQFRWWGNTKLR